MSVISKNAKPIVAIHGSASTGAQWQRLSDAMAPEYIVLRPDLPGYGLAITNGHLAQQTISAEAAHLDQLLGLYCKEQVHLVGHSFGAVVALKLAMRRPDLIASLTLIEPAVFHILRAQPSKDDLSAYGEIVELRNELNTEGMKSFVDYWNGAGTWDCMKVTAQSRLHDLVPSVDRNFEAALSENWDLADCNKFTWPTQIIRGTHSQRPALRTAQHLAAAIPSCALHDIAGAGHMAPITHSDETNKLVHDHIVLAEQLQQTKIKQAA